MIKLIIWYLTDGWYQHLMSVGIKILMKGCKDGNLKIYNMKWWEVKVKGWTVPFWYTDTPIISKRAACIGTDKLAKMVRDKRLKDKFLNKGRSASD